jgi:hypothetical protein
LEARCFASFHQHNNSAYCGNGSEIFRFLLPIVCVEVRCFASFTNTTIVYIVGMEAKHFASCSVPIVCMETRCSASFTNTTILCIVGMEAKHFASCTFDIYMFDIYRRRLIMPELLWFFIYQKLILYFTVE